MDLHCLHLNQLPDDHRGQRTHRFMESADIGCAFRETFIALRANVRRGLRTCGQLYALEMDSCIPGELLDTTWLPPSVHGLPVEDGSVQAGATTPGADGHESPDTIRRRHARLCRLLDLPGAAALLVWVGERCSGDGHPVLRVELASADGLFAAEHLLCPGRGWRRLDLLRAPHQRCASDALA